MSKQTTKFVTGALILTGAGILSKFVNMFFKVPLHANIGDAGLAFYYAPYPIYTIFMALFLGGVAAAMSKLVSEKLAFNKYDEAHEIFKYMMKILICLGTISSIGLIIFGETIVKLAGWDLQTIYTLRGMSLSPLILAIIGGFRGYFQGMQDMKPAAFSQVIESILKVFIGIFLVRLLLGNGYSIAHGAGGAAWGLTIGSIAAMLFLLVYYKQYQKKIDEKMLAQPVNESRISKKDILMHLWWIAIPIAIGAACYTFINLVDSFTIIRGLTDLGFDYESANVLMSQKIKADTFINIPMVISMALVVSIIPAISEAKALKDEAMVMKKIDITTKIAYLIALPATFGVMILAKPLLEMIFFADPSGEELLKIGSLCILFITMAQCYTAILQGVGKIYNPLLNLVIVVSVKILINRALINEALTVKGAMIGSITAYALLALLSYYQVRKYTGYKIGIGLLIKGMLSAGIMASVTFLCKSILLNLHIHIAITTVVSVGIGVCVYGVSVLVLKIVSEEDYEYLPMGSIIYKIIRKWS